MAASNNIIKAALELSIDKFKSGIRNAVSSIVDLDAAGKKNSDRLKKGFDEAGAAASRLEQNIARAAKAFIVGFAAHKIKSVISDYISEGEELAVATSLNERKLAQVMRNTMDASEEEVESILRLAEAQEQLGVVSKTAQVSAAAELASFAEKKETIEGLLPVINDYIAYMYGTTATDEQARNTATAVGKAMQGTFDGLSKQGFKFDEVQESILKYGTEAQKAKVLMEALGESVGGMNAELAQGDLGKLNTLSNIVSDTQEKIGGMVIEAKGGIAGELIPIVERLSESFLGSLSAAYENMKATGVFERIAQSIGRALEASSDFVVQLIQGLPAAIEMGANAIQWLTENFNQLIDSAKAFLALYVELKIAMAVSKPILGVASALGVFKKAADGAKLSAQLFTLVLNSIKAFTIVGVIMLIVQALKWAWDTFDGFKIAVLGGVQSILDALARLSSYVPFFGDALSKAFGSAANAVEGSINKIKNKVNEAKQSLSSLQSGAGTSITVSSHVGAAVKGISSTKKYTITKGEPREATDEEKAAVLRDPYIVGEEAAAKYRAMDEAAKAKDYFADVDTSTYIPEPGGSSSSGGGSGGVSGGGSAVTDIRTALEKGIDNVEDRFKTREDLIDSEISKYDAQGNEKEKKASQKSSIDLLKEKLLAYTGLDKLASSSDERNILETAKNKILTEIAKLTNDIKGDLAKLVGSFNTPSEFTALTEYAYNTSTTNNSVLTRIISTPTLNMTLNVKDLGGASAAEVRNKANAFADTFMGKNDVVSDGWGDVLRN